MNRLLVRLAAVISTSTWLMGASQALALQSPTPVAPTEHLGMVGISSSRGSCSGMLIGSNTVLTAAHCVCSLNWVSSNSCDTTVDVFDGSRRSRLRLAKPAPDGEALVCAGTFARIEGEAHSMADLREFPFRLVFVPNGGGLYQLDRIEAPTNFGQAVLSRQG